MKSAFTLIEVLVVVAIIALLVSILIPTLARARDQARSAKCLANMRDMSTGVFTFAATHRDRFQLVAGGPVYPDPNSATGPVPDPDRKIYAYESLSGQPPALLAWPVVLLREAGVRSLKKNSDWGIWGEANAAANQADIPRFEQMVCPADDIKFGTPLFPDYFNQADKYCYGYLSYGINEDINGCQTDLDDPDPVWKDGEPSNGAGDGGERLLGQLSKVVRPAEVLMFTDAGSDKPLGQQGPVAHLIISRKAHGPLLEYAEAVPDWPARLPKERHRRGSLNITFADGHGGFTKYSPHTPANPALEPDFVYRPKVRVSPYNPGAYPAPF